MGCKDSVNFGRENATNMRILLVEDEESLMDVIRLNLEMEGYEVVPATTGPAGLEKLRRQSFDLAILDVMLPEMDGFTVCEQARSEGVQVPVLFLTAKSASTDRVKGLKLGDDYLTKPFNLEELLLRVEKLLHRKQPEPKPKGLTDYEFGGNKVSFTTYEIDSVNAGRKTLTDKECRVLKLLIEKENEVVSREQILTSVWGDDAFPSGRTIDNLVVSFRKYFESDPKEPRHFHSIRGVGYKFTS